MQGVQPVMDAIVDYLPHPLDRPPVLLQSGDASKGKGGKTEEIRRKALPSEPLCAMAFKVVHDKHRGPLVYTRVFSGVLSDRTLLNNSTRHVRERVNKIFQVSANHYTEIGQVTAGNIALIGGLKDTFTGDTLLGPSDKSKVQMLA